MEPELRINLRSVQSTPSFRDTNDRPESPHSTASRGRSRRHGLLRLLKSEDQFTKDLPAPPILTPGPLEPARMNFATSQKLLSVSVPAINSSGLYSVTPNRETSVSDNAEAHEEVDDTIAVKRGHSTRTPSRKSSPDEMENCTLTGQLHHRIKSKDPGKEVDVSDHIHIPYNSVMKVRPAIGLLQSDESHGGHVSASKVRRASEEVSGHEIIHHSGTYGQRDSASEKSYTLEQHVHHGHNLAPKIGAFFDWGSLQEIDHTTSSSDIHEGHLPVHKVQSHHDPTSKAEENAPQSLAAEKQTGKGQDESSNITSYWDFLPIFGQKRDEDAGATDEAKDRSNPRVSRKTAHSSSSKSKEISAIMSRGRNQPSLSASQYSSASQKSLEAATKALAKMTAELTSNQENVRHSMRSTTSSGKTLGNTHLHEKPALQEHNKGDIASMSDVSPTSHPSLVKSDKDQAEQGSPLEMIDPRRAASWIRQLLGYRESNSTNLTQLPEKSHPRHQEHDDYPNDSDNAVSSRVTTFSGENAADAGAMETAMHHLERLLSEALVLANQVTEQDQDQCGHIDDEELRAYLRTLSHSNEDVRMPSTTFVGAVEGVGHGCSTLPSMSANPPKLTKPNIRDGNVRRHYVSEDSCVLPMPPPDRKLKRQRPTSMQRAYSEDDPTGVIKHRTKDVPNSREVREYIRVFHQPPITPRQSSRNLRKASQEADTKPHQSSTSEDVVDFSTQYNHDERRADAPPQRAPSNPTHEVRNISLRKRSHVSIRNGQKFSLTKSVKRQPIIARDWSPARKRFVASVACLSTALIGILIGIYAGLVPSIQYYIADFHHYSILGNVGMYLGMALSSFFCWPLPLLHGRKPYVLCSLCVAMPLLFPQAIAVSVPRSPFTSTWRWALLLSRAVIGWALGFASMNFHSMLTDLFGASLMSRNPHQEVVDYHDVRRHGGGLGIWLGVWTWCFIGSLGVGFLVGAVVIDTLSPSWGLYISIILIAVVLLLNVVCPEVRRSAWRYSVAEVKMGSTVSRRVGRGEIMMHRVKDGPKWWGQEMYHGIALSLSMLRQPGFVVMALYSAWIYAQVVLIIVLLGSLTSRHYRFRSPYVGAAVSSVAVGALAAVPFQMANLFSRFRSIGPVTNSMTFDKKVTWTSHLVRRAVFVIVLPIAGILYTVVSSGPPVHLVFPCIFAAIIGFLSCLAIAECNGMLMEAWDCSDMQPGMTGRSRSGTNGEICTNYSSFPRVTAGWNTIHSIGFVFAAGATGIGGIVTRSLGQRAATGIVASILFLHSVLLLAVFARFRRVQIIPNSKSMEMERWTKERRDSLRRRASAIAAAKSSGLKDISEIPEEDFRRMNILELGSLTRWSEIRRLNLLIDEGVHLNRQAVDIARDELGRRRDEFIGDIGQLVRKVSKRSIRSKYSQDSDHEDHIELQDIGPLTHTGAGHEHQHQHTTLPPEVYLERECVMGQTVPEEKEEVSSMDGGSDDDYGYNHTQAHSSHMTSKVEPYAGFELQKLRGSRLSTGDYIINMDASHTEPKVNLVDRDASKHRGQHGAHMGNKVEPAGLGVGIRPANLEFEEVDLSGRSERRDSKTTKQD
ncbi:hypothetical protein GGR53DRAFT_521698 [Hypoxylon sp. FL1150]|nr:hypothetical protein GGR53DRAFT_521698 [Hypoxylon sp. FL1150]